jgi:dihydrofolate reductase
MIISLIVAIADNGCIGNNNELPWPRIAEDMKWFKTHTKDKIVLMGNNTWKSLPKKPLPDRVNVVMTRGTDRDFLESDLSIMPDHLARGTPEEIIDDLRKRYPDHQELMVMGGAQVYKLFRRLANRLYVTRIGKDFEGDCFLNLDLAENEFDEPFFTHTTKGADFDITYEIRDRKYDTSRTTIS